MSHLDGRWRRQSLVYFATTARLIQARCVSSPRSLQAGRRAALGEENRRRGGLGCIRVVGGVLTLIEQQHLSAPHRVEYASPRFEERAV